MSSHGTSSGTSRVTRVSTRCTSSGATSVKGRSSTPSGGGGAGGSVARSTREMRWTPVLR